MKEEMKECKKQKVKKKMFSENVSLENYQLNSGRIGNVILSPGFHLLLLC